MDKKASSWLPIVYIYTHIYIYIYTCIYIYIYIYKCSTFGVKKFSTKSLQFTPKLLINNQRIPAVKIGEAFRYLGRYFDYEMSNKQLQLDAKATLTDLLQQIDSLNIHPKSKRLLYQKYVLSKLSWHFTVADISKTWVIQNLDNTLISYVRNWLDLPISATISHLTLSKSKFGLNLQLPSTKFLQCQTVLRNTLKSSPNDNIKSLWENTSSGSNIQYDIYQDTKQVLKAVRSANIQRIQHDLSSQGAILSAVFKKSFPRLTSTWSSVQGNLSKNIFNFTVRYMNNTLATRKNFLLLKLSQTSDCSFCLLPESLLHVVAGCKVYLEEGRYTWRHNSVLNFVAASLQSVKGATLFVDLPSFPSPSVITGDTLRPDLLLETADNILHILELTIGFETNIKCNAERKEAKYSTLVKNLRKYYQDVKFINLSLSCLGIYDQSCTKFMDMYNELKLESRHQKYIISKITNIAIRTTYYIFCCRNKPWTSPNLLPF